MARGKVSGAFRDGDFMRVSQTGLSEVQQRLRDRTLGSRSMCVLLEMLANMGWDNRVEISQKELASVLGMTASEVSTASHTLLDCGFVTRLNNRRGWYRISTRLAWKGSPASHRAAVTRGRDEEYLSQFEIEGAA